MLSGGLLRLLWELECVLRTSDVPEVALLEQEPLLVLRLSLSSEGSVPDLTIPSKQSKISWVPLFKKVALYKTASLRTCDCCRSGKKMLQKPV